MAALGWLLNLGFGGTQTPTVPLVRMPERILVIEAPTVTLEIN